MQKYIFTIDLRNIIGYGYTYMYGFWLHYIYIYKSIDIVVAATHHKCEYTYNPMVLQQIDILEKWLLKQKNIMVR